jgi:hypothetical protein
MTATSIVKTHRTNTDSHAFSIATVVQAGGTGDFLVSGGAAAGAQDQECEECG